MNENISILALILTFSKYEARVFEFVIFSIIKYLGFLIFKKVAKSLGSSTKGIIYGM